MYKQIRNTNYEINEYGDVRSIITKLNIKHNILNGYHYVHIKENGICKTMPVHRLVYEIFVGEIPSNLEIDHIDNNKDNNHYSNLQALTHKENCQKRGCPYKGHLNDKHPRSKKVEMYDENDNLIDVYPSTMEIERKYGITHSQVIKCCNGQINKTRKGFSFKYVE